MKGLTIGQCQHCEAKFIQLLGETWKQRKEKKGTLPAASFHFCIATHTLACTQLISNTPIN